LRITGVSTIALGLPYEMGGPKPQFAGRTRTVIDVLLVRVDTDAGITGWGEAFGYAVWPATQTAIEKVIAPLCVGREAGDIAGLMLELQKKLHLVGRTGPVVYGLSGIDIALWDIAGKAAGKPLHALLGGAHHTRLPAYASLMRYGNVDLVSANATAAVRDGYRAIKLHETTVEAVAAARAATGPNVALTMDTNCPWNVEEALSVARAVQPYGLTWLEEPIWPPEDYSALAKVRREGGVAIAAGENAMSVTDFAHMFASGAVDYAQPSVTKIGGVSELQKIACLCAAHGVRFQPHSPYFGPGFLATLHVAAVQECEPWIERSYCALHASPMGAWVTPEGGELRVPAGPGLGADPDPAVLERCRVAA
jgi:L-alanine-DL-glutamate epimerase-like enolase superfamily enzyme